MGERGKAEGFTAWGVVPERLVLATHARKRIFSLFLLSLFFSFFSSSSFPWFSTCIYTQELYLLWELVSPISRSNSATHPSYFIEFIYLRMQAGEKKSVDKALTVCLRIIMASRFWRRKKKEITLVKRRIIMCRDCARLGWN